MAKINIKLPEKHYVTFNAREKNIPIAFLTPYGTDSAAKKRMATADSWGNSRYYGSQEVAIDPQTVDNVLMSGFKIAHSVSRYSTSNVVWRIEDPRGFELEISSNNLSDLISITTIENGEIQERCIWARQGAQNVLIAENDEVYQEAVENSTRVTKKASMRDVQPGNSIVLQNGTKGEYLGSFHLVKMSGSRQSGHGVEIEPKRKHYIFVKGNSGGGYNEKHDRVFAITSPKVSEITDFTIITETEAEQRINNGFINKDFEIVTGNDDTIYSAIGVVSKSKEEPILELNLVPVPDPKALFLKIEKNMKDRYWRGQTLLAEYGTDWILGNMSSFCADNRYHHYQTKSEHIKGKTINILELYENLQFVDDGSRTYDAAQQSSYRWHRSQGVTPIEVRLDSPEVKWYIPCLVIVNPTTENKFELPLP